MLPSNQLAAFRLILPLLSREEANPPSIGMSLLAIGRKALTLREERSRFRLVFLLVLVLRLAMASAPVATYDAVSYSIVAQAVSSGQTVYAATARYNYSPVWSFRPEGPLGRSPADASRSSCSSSASS